ncbi:hypothetical protein NG798_19950 [Ancylothrix sp. C2]|uniref:hypothetical protein n=1 Tax=Ancylothrix sp. D3o TaxID=2953691 RepID=UPI0021BAF39F|nr:hypothetical protein [Ancylothrix sp. D3o]MCT7952076.1 hypothetical protein [Ancylothrix sp. D3o]
MAFQEQWELEAKKRQAQVQARKQKIQANLAELQKQRQTKAVQVREKLSVFRENLATTEESRQQEENLRAAKRQEFCESLHRHTEIFLTNSARDRQLSAQKMAEELESYVSFLQERTREFLEQTATNRRERAAQLHEDLALFEAALAAVSEQRRQRQIELENLKEKTQEFLSVRHLERLETKAELTDKLTIFREDLRSGVQTYLQELELKRVERAENLQGFLQKSQSDRTAAVKALFSRFAEYRRQLNEYRDALQAEVWGTNAEEIKPQPQKPATVAALKVEMPKKIEKPKSEPAAILKSNAVAFEVEVYHYILQKKGARLLELETALAINRIQAVDALRSLVQKNLIVQRDRLYIPVN